LNGMVCPVNRRRVSAGRPIGTVESFGQGMGCPVDRGQVLRISGSGRSVSNKETWKGSCNMIGLDSGSGRSVRKVGDLDRILE